MWDRCESSVATSVPAALTRPGNHRTYALDEDESAMCARAKEACELLGVRRLVMGHTPHFEGPVARCGGRVLLIDTGTTFQSEGPFRNAC